jgi:hypothetical protein
MITGMGNQAANVHNRLLALVTTHGTIAFLDPPADTTLTTIVRSIDHSVPIGILPGSIKSQPRPKIPTIEEKVTHAISDRMRNLFGLFGIGITMIQFFQFELIIWAVKMDHRFQKKQVGQGLFRPT